jgi:hypothetical protein
MTPLKSELSLKQISIGAIARDTKQHKADVSNFVNGNLKRCSKSTRKVLRDYFLKLGLIKPKPRKPSRCHSCGALYPTRKLRIKFELPVAVLIDDEVNAPLSGRQDTSDKSRSQ